MFWESFLLLNLYLESFVNVKKDNRAILQTEILGEAGFFYSTSNSFSTV